MDTDVQHFVENFSDVGGPTFIGGGGTPILGHTRDVRPEWVSFRGPKTCGWVIILMHKTSRLVSVSIILPGNG